MKKVLLPLIVFLLPLILCAQDIPSGYQILFKSTRILPERNIQAARSVVIPGQSGMFDNTFFRIIQFDEIPSAETRKALSDGGVHLLDYLPHMAWFAAFDKDFKQPLLENKKIRNILEILPEYKLDPKLIKGDFPPHALQEAGILAIDLVCFPNLDFNDVTHALTNVGYSIIAQYDAGHTCRVHIPVGDIRKLAEMPFVMFMEPASAEPVPENYTGRTLHHGNAIATEYLTGRHFDGTGVNLMLQDDGVIGPHIDYQGRIGAQYLTNNNGDHGDHCAGILMAAGNRDPKGKGNAFGATLWVYSVSPNYPGFNAIPSVYITPGIRVTSCSYGDGCNSGYTSLTRTLDQQVRLYPGLFHVFSAGNSGSSDCGYGAGPGWGNITGGHKTGKNVIAVANLNLQDALESSSSRGPTSDGRIKPDLAAKGTDVYSTINPNAYDIKTGTSMACPGVAGTLAQLIQAYKSLHSGKDPMAGLVKGIALNTAEDLGNPGPDFKFGWGRINALRAVKVMEENRYDTGVITQGATKTHNVVVPPNTAQLRVMVYWTDYEGTVNSTLPLVNNINISLTDPASVVWNPWVLSSYPHPDSLNKPAVRGTDNLNNMEQVSLNNPAAGSYLLTVYGNTIPQGPQTYYVIYEFIPDAVVLTYPLGGENLVPGESELIRWDAFGNNGPFVLLFSADNGQSWDTINANLPGDARAFTWIVPATMTGKGLIRIVGNGSESQSAAPFSIIGLPCNVAVDWVCNDTLHLSWSAVPGAEAYEVFSLGERNMEPRGMTSQLFFKMDSVSLTQSTWLSVRALGPDGTTGRRTIAIEKTPGNINCRQTDVAMEAAPTPAWGLFQNSLGLHQVHVSVKIRNSGAKVVSSCPVKYNINGGTIHSGVINGVLMPDSTTSFEFSETIDLSLAGTVLFKTWAELPGDQNKANDTLACQLETISSTAVQSGYVQSFDSWTKCNSAPVCELYSCPLEQEWNNIPNGQLDQHDWRTYAGTTPTSATGPDVDHTTGTSSGKYLYLEPTMNCLNKSANLITPALDLTGSSHPVVSLWVHAYGADMGSLHADIFDGSVVTEEVVPPVTGNKGNQWKQLQIDLLPWAGKMISLRVRGVTSCKDKGDLAIDDFMLSEFTGLENNQVNSDYLRIYPNPSAGEVMFILKNAGTGTWDFHLLDMMGRVVEQSLVTPAEGAISFRTDISDLPRGIYIAELRSGGKVIRGKVIKW